MSEPAVAFPPPRTTAQTIPRDSVLSDISSPDLLLVDVRRTDYEGGTIAGSINLPAQSFCMNRAVLYGLCERAGVKRVAFYCGSSSGRGPRCAGWFADYIAEKGGEGVQALTLEGGIKGWIKAGEPYTQHVDGFEPEYWKQFE
ncbi:Rhodanese-like protein [Dothidotthia symphoricarpi CBS 119687]|uniref:Rhodanese-like protein n=1 Tax=Dothidotthia symphoricarpi CBS 119687 TaxID=1392245 RepID=A0A6A6AL59_9PLEO|nr:Rhodanese-like protein [Dothidotthia symphoricarpi CBS 119687]KAF2132540.1 Rhodanese-like protein [Dothidotthia symphoricarpi CBS 119687]